MNKKAFANTLVWIGVSICVLIILFGVVQLTKRWWEPLMEIAKSTGGYI